MDVDSLLMEIKAGGAYGRREMGDNGERNKQILCSGHAFIVS